jgi:hypothetical protein
MKKLIEIFVETNENSENSFEKIKQSEQNKILKNLCSIKENSIILNYIYFKHFATNETYSCILNYISNNIDIILLNNDNFVVHVNMKNLTIVDIDKHKAFIQYISLHLKEAYPRKLCKCYVYNSPFVFNQIYNILCMFIDKETQKKIELVVNK